MKIGVIGMIGTRTKVGVAVEVGTETELDADGIPNYCYCEFHDAPIVIHQKQLFQCKSLNIARKVNDAKETFGLFRTFKA